MAEKRFVEEAVFEWNNVYLTGNFPERVSQYKFDSHTTTSAGK